MLTPFGEFAHGRLSAETKPGISLSGQLNEERAAVRVKKSDAE
jgi:hypothetical protein